MQEQAPYPARYHSAAIALHWVIAMLLVYQFTLGLRLDDATGPTKFTAFQLHKSIGITVLLLSLLRLALRIALPRPAEVGDEMDQELQVLLLSRGQVVHENNSRTKPGMSP